MNLQTNSPVRAPETFDDGSEHDTLTGKASPVGLTLESSPPSANDDDGRGPYASYAEIFSRVYGDTASIETALEVVDALRTREAVLPPVIPGLPDLVIKVVAQLFSLKPKLLFGATGIAMWRPHDMSLRGCSFDGVGRRPRLRPSSISITRRSSIVCAWSPETPICSSRRTRPSNSSHSRASEG